MNREPIEGAQPRTFTSKKTYRDGLSINDIEGAQPMHMRGYGGHKKE